MWNKSDKLLMCVMPLIAFILLTGMLFPADTNAMQPRMGALGADGILEGADYWRDEPMILSAGMGFDNIIGLPELTEETVRGAGGSWYGSVTCTNGEEPNINFFTSAS
ncbi:MAG: hypothetical protein KJ043_17575 [Anaerolineae bacterium]|nr:hypothetical protein [Anaerolineae bacterium]